jgi:uncharacterized protein (DUF488 family)
MALSDIRLFTIGHSNYAFADFVALLRQHAIARVVDIRSAPYSKYCPHFCKPYFEEHLFSEFGIEYQFYGHVLGGRRPDVRQLSDTNVSLPQDVLKALAELLHLASDSRIALMCGEENPYTCHRHMILAKRLLQQDFKAIHGIELLEIWHIRGDGSIELAVHREEQMVLPF